MDQTRPETGYGPDPMPRPPRRGWVWALLSVLAVAALWYTYWPVRSDIQWLGDFEAAQAMARATQKPILLYFSSDQCPPCRVMSRRTWPDDRVEQRVTEGFVPLKVDIADLYRPTPLAHKYGASALPMLVLLNEKGDMVAPPLQGYASPQVLLDYLEGS